MIYAITSDGESKKQHRDDFDITIGAGSNDIKVSEPKLGQGLRYNQGKTRYDLLPSYPIDQLAQVLTKGAEKYAPRNWELGMPWSKITASLKRHLSAIESGEDFDKETGLLHASHVLCNAAFLVEYYKTHPEHDDRPHKYLTQKRIGLDLDDVIVGFMEGFGERFGYGEVDSWNFTYQMRDHFKSLFDNEEAKEFFLNLKPAVDPKSIPFEPTAYVTARSIPVEWNQEWLQKHGFPTVPVYAVPFNQSKVEAIKDAKLDYFIDDRYENFIELNKAGICTFLWDRPHNKRYDVGYKRIFGFEDFKNRFL
jgi:hypothetical protein